MWLENWSHWHVTWKMTSPALNLQNGSHRASRLHLLLILDPFRECKLSFNHSEINKGLTIALHQEILISQEGLLLTKYAYSPGIVMNCYISIMTKICLRICVMVPSKSVNMIINSIRKHLENSLWEITMCYGVRWFKNLLA